MASISTAAAPPKPTPLPRWGDGRRTRIGLLGGSFNPIHAGHIHIARVAQRRLRLHQVWLLVSPGNPLKPTAGMAPLAERLPQARATVASAGLNNRRILATDIEARMATRYTLDTLRSLRTRFPRARFIWLMGADNLEQFPRWKGWMNIAREMQIAVLPRPAYTARALAGQAAQRLRHTRIAGTAAPALADHKPPAWVFITARENPLSATQLRQQRT